MASKQMQAPTPAAPLAPWSENGQHQVHATAELDELEVALRSDLVTFHEVARAWFGVHDQELPDDVRERYRALFGKLLKRFGTLRGGIESDYFCEHLRVAAALTDIEVAARAKSGVRKDVAKTGSSERWTRRRDSRRYAAASAIHIEPLLGDPECLLAKQLLSRGLDIHYRALEFLRPEHRKVCLRRIFAAIAVLLGTLDNRKGKGEKVTLTREEAAALTRDLDEAEAYYEKHAERRAQLWYLAGMVVGLLLTLAILVAIVVLAPGVAEGDTIIVALFAGALGAMMSVMMRLSRGRLTLEREAASSVRVLLGAVRPFVGAVFGGLLYVLVQGGLLTSIELPPQGAKEVATFAGLAFLAGFSERVADSVVAQGSRVLGGSDDPPDGRAGRDSKG